MGRPVRPSGDRKRISLGLRVTAEIKDQLDHSAVKNGRSQSQEAELRIEQSFRDGRIEAILHEILKRLPDVNR